MTEDAKTPEKPTGALKLKTLHRLRPGEVKALCESPGKHNDGGSLYLHVRRPGVASWVFELRDGKTRRSIGLGACPPVTIADARKARQEILNSRVPRPGRKSRFLVAPTPLTAPTVADPQVAPVAGTWAIDDTAKPFGKTADDFFNARVESYSPERLAYLRSMVTRHLVPLHHRPMREITRQEIADTLRPIWNGSVDSTGRKLRSVIETIFDSASINPNPATLAAVTSITNGLPKKTTVKQKSVASLPYADVPKLMTELATHDGDVARMIRFIILTGVRVKEALGATWDEIKSNSKHGMMWEIPAERMKMDVPHTVALSAEAIAVLGERGEGLIFRGERFGREIGQNVALRFLNTFGRTDAKGVKITLHGFRSSLATWGEECEPPFAAKVIHFNLAHFSKEDKVTKAYLRADMWSKRREMMEAWGKWNIQKD